LKGLLVSHKETILCLVKLHNYAIDNKVAMPCNTDKDCDQYKTVFASSVNEFDTEVFVSEHWRIQYNFSNSVA
jgi:hypothetical protein